ncbi:MAG: Omp28-related outer membrane protein [Bacteroidetes bacterium]|nr:Omp28-related outer membrane protein [Bacteroidota bacterium]MBT5989960.1 Omp28-related outer membrane protein [Bacteroidota bacterium]
MKQALLLFLLLGITKLHPQQLISTELSTGNKKNVLLEVSTSALVQYSPEGDLFAQNIKDSIPNCIVVKHHCFNFFKDSMSIPQSKLWFSSYLTGIPSATVDRSITSIGGSSIGLGRDNWQEAINERLAMTARYQLNMKINYNSDNRKIVVKLKGKALENFVDYIIFNLYVVEDSVHHSGPGYDQLNNYNNTPGHPFYGKGDPIKNYMHMDVVRDMLKGPWGDFGATNPSLNQEDSLVFSFTVPLQINIHNLRIVGTVAIWDFYELGNREILNCIDSKIANCSLIKTNPTDQTATLGAQTQFIVEAIDSHVTYQWQVDEGTAYKNLINDSQYFGVTNDTLIVSNLLESNNNQKFRCCLSLDQCNDISTIALLHITSTSKVQKDYEKFHIYPNPVSTILSIQIPFEYIGTNYIITDISGKMMLHGKLMYSTNQIEIKELADGFYFIKHANSNDQPVKFLKKSK